ncbi:MAG TPA: hypothetical protein VGD94_18230 [Vicinamibacterales bacterium]
MKRPHVAGLLAYGGGVAEHPPGFAGGVARIHSVFDQLPPALFDVTGDLVPQLVVQAATPEA